MPLTRSNGQVVLDVSSRRALKYSDRSAAVTCAIASTTSDMVTRRPIGVVDSTAQERRTSRACSVRPTETYDMIGMVPYDTVHNGQL